MTITTIPEIRRVVADARRRGSRIGCVPTMGALHDGHASLIRRARELSDFVVTTVFVNPTQFGPNEDFSRYPRTLDHDVEIAMKNGSTVIFTPPVDEIYSSEAVTTVEVAKLGDHLCGPSRPGHFRGVATIVLKLFNIVQPDVAVFGAKDGQQVRIIRKMVDDLNVPVTIDISPTVREPDGLAMSSRNRYLSPTDRAVAPGLYKALCDLRKRVSAGETDVARLESSLRTSLESIPGSRIDYASIVDDLSLQPVRRLERPALASIAVFLGNTRLIDNVTLP